MPFEDLVTIANPPKDVLASISYRRNTFGKKPNPHPKLIIGIPAKFCPQSKSTGPKKGEKAPTAPTVMWTFQVGTGDDAGLARIVPADVGVQARALRGGALAFRFGYVPALGKDAADKDYVPISNITTSKGPGFEIKLPDWFKQPPPR